MSEIIITQAVEDDLKYITSSWLRTYIDSPEMRMPNLVHSDYYYHTHRFLDEIISRSSKLKALYVAREPAAPSIIHGYLCCEPYEELTLVHWAAVKRPMWGRKIFTRMMDKFLDDFKIPHDVNLLYTFSSKTMTKPIGKHLADKYSLVYYPWLKYDILSPQGVYKTNNSAEEHGERVFVAGH